MRTVPDCPLSAVKLYSAAIVLFVWAAVWAAGIHGQVVVTIGLVSLGAAALISEMERSRLRKNLQAEIDRNDERRRCARR